MTEFKFWSKLDAIEKLSRRFPHLFANQTPAPSGTITAQHLDMILDGFLVVFRRHFPPDQVIAAILEVRQVVERAGASPKALLAEPEAADS